MSVVETPSQPGILLRSGFFTPLAAAERMADMYAAEGVADGVLRVYDFLDPLGVAHIAANAHGNTIITHSAGTPEVLDAVADAVEASEGEVMPAAVVAIAGPERFTKGKAPNTGTLVVKGVARQLELGFRGLVLPGDHRAENRQTAAESLLETLRHGHEYIPRTPDITKGPGESRGSTIRGLNRLADLGVTAVRVTPVDDLMFRGAHKLSPQPNVTDRRVSGSHDSPTYDPSIAIVVADTLDMLGVNRG